MYAQETGEAFLVLLTIEHDELQDPVRLVNNTEAVLSKGREFLAFPFTLVPPPDDEQANPTAELVLDNTGQLLVATLRSISSPPRVSFEIVAASTPDVIEQGPIRAEWIGYSMNTNTVRATLKIESTNVEPFPVQRFDPFNFPGLFNDSTRD